MRGIAPWQPLIIKPFFGQPTEKSVDLPQTGRYSLAWLTMLANVLRLQAALDRADPPRELESPREIVGKVHAKVQLEESIAAGGCRSRRRNHIAVRVRCHSSSAASRLEWIGAAGGSNSCDADIESLHGAGHEC